MRKTILITGDAGFIDSHLTDELLLHGYTVRILDGLAPPVPEEPLATPEQQTADAERLTGPIDDRVLLRRALKGVDAVFHLATRIGEEPNAYQILDYTMASNIGTAILMEELMEHRVERLVVVSSMSIYGEGLYQAAEGGAVALAERSLAQLRAGDWEVRDEQGRALRPLPTPETKPPAPASVYALSKYDQERMGLLLGRTYQIPTVALRCFNVFGPRPTPSPFSTGVLARLAAQLLDDQPPVLFEDGRQRRDFVHVRDVARAGRLALEVPEAAYRVFNIGSGHDRTLLEAAEQLARVLGKPHIEPQISARFREGDVRHCFADIRLAGEVLGYRPQIDFEEGLTEFAAWFEGEFSRRSRHLSPCGAP